MRRSNACLLRFSSPYYSAASGRDSLCYLCPTPPWALNHLLVAMSMAERICTFPYCSLVHLGHSVSVLSSSRLTWSIFIMTFKSAMWVFVKYTVSFICARTTSSSLSVISLNISSMKSLVPLACRNIAVWFGQRVR